MVVAGYSSHVSSLPVGARPHLELQLDWGNEGVDKDLIEIAYHMLDWEEKLCSHMGLTEVDVHDIKAIHRDNPELQRHVSAIMRYGVLRSALSASDVMQERGIEEVEEL